MEIKAIHEGRDAACRMPGSVRQRMLAGVIHPDDIAYRADSTSSDMDEYLRRLTTRFFGESVWELHNIN